MSARGRRGDPEAQVKAALTMLSRNIGKCVDADHASAALARCSEIRSIVIDKTFCPTSMTGHPSGCRCRR